MERESKPLGLATVKKIRAQRRRGRPYKTLSGAVAQSASERYMLLVLRKRIAAQLDGDDLQPAAFGALVRQFRQIDQQLRALDAAAAAADEADDDDDDDGAFDLSKI